ncbi:MAG: methyltransferase domain-containing protein [Phycisphaerales bacterium]|nr:methyltransferase domain-containing protein [Phycisphaerales bacterium]
MSTAAPAGTPTPDFAAIKQRQQATWATGDFSHVAARIVFTAELLAETADLQAGWRVLDVATGSGNAALAAARRGCEVTGLDYVPALLERGRVRAAAEYLDVTFTEGDAEALPFRDASFDAVMSIFGAMFAPDHQKTARELARVCKPGGRIALASWTPGGFVGEMFRIVSAHLPPAPGLAPPSKWGDPHYLAALFEGRARLHAGQVRQATFRFRSAEEYVEFFRTWFGPTIRAFAAMPPDRQQVLAREIADLARRFDRNGGAGPVAIVGDYLETVMIRV